MRHIGAYIDLAGLELARAQRDMTAQVVMWAIVAVCGLFAVFMACLGVIAYTWDTAYRVAAIAWMCGGFLVISIGALIYGFRLARQRSALFTDVRREWQEDRVILERVLSSDEDWFVADRDASARSLIRARLAQSREELRAILDPPPGDKGGGGMPGESSGGFPRSRIMRMMLSGRGLGTLGALASGLLLALPALALRLLKLVPAGAVAKILMAKAMDALKSKSAAE